MGTAVDRLVGAAAGRHAGGALGGADLACHVAGPTRRALPLARSLDGVAWVDVPVLQGPRGLARRAPGWGGLRLALPTGDDSDATYLAAQSIAAGVAHAVGPIADSVARGPQVGTTLARLASGAPKARPETTVDALNALAAQKDPKAGAIHAVPVTEQELYAYTAAHPDSGIVGVALSGGTASATFPAVSLDDQSLSDAQTHGAADFVTFLGRDANARPLAAAGFRVPDQPTPKATAAVAFATVEPLPAPSVAALTAIADAVTTE
ncbi:hypothetical protein [Tsukamurella soli]|uniref:hypothetical protein n=1 Tax=Tsukamurella soli TaxID=644556 RepID=UPI003614EE39